MNTQRSLISIFKSSPLFIALAVAAVVVFGLSFINYAKRGGFWSPEVEARVFTNSRDGRSGDVGPNGERRFTFQGEVYSDAERLRESSAIAIGGMLVSADRRLNNRAIQNVESLLSEMFSSELVPPGIQFDKSKNCLSSIYANYYVRYRQTPLGVEVVSECKGQLCGPTVLVRLPDDGFSQDALTYYMAPSSGVVLVPAAFCSAAEVIKAGWHPETFKAQSGQIRTVRQ
jgi:hypothetical protein